MTQIDYYENVRQKLTLGPLSAAKHEKIYELLKLFWDLETIKVLSHFPPADKYISMKELVEKSSIPRIELKKILKKELNKKTIQKAGAKYALLPLVPGIFEGYFIARQDTQENIKRAASIYRYIFENMVPLDMIDKNFELFRPLLPIETKEKLIKIDESVELQTKILPYELVEELINTNEYFAVVPCQCRLIAELDGNPCKIASSEMGCFLTGMAAQASASSGAARALNKEEAIEYLKKTEEAGLVHCCTDDSGPEHTQFICNCCSCHCGALRPTKEFQFKAVKPSNFAPKIDYELCALCETCIDKCPMSVISNQNEKIIVNYEKCIGCGICAMNCPNNAILMEKVRNVIPPKRKEIGNKTFVELLM